MGDDDMKTTYEINGFLKYAERDNWENGCLGGGQEFWIDMRLSDSSISGLKNKILSFIGAPDDAMDCDACEEAGRIDIQKTENDDGLDPSSREEAAFKAGEIDLWAATYTCHVERVTREIVSTK
jgi:hypothetical protein